MAKAKVTFVGEDRTKGAFASVGKSFGGLTGSLKGATSALAGFGAVLGGALVLGAFKKVIAAGSELQETAQKFGVVFKAVGKEAEIVSANLARDFGLSEKAAKGLLAATGDLLTGFGFTDKAALDLSNQVQELSVDLASFSNLEGGAERASEILTKALLGERDALVSLGIKIGETDLKQRALADGLELVSGKLSKQDTALLTLKIATEQSAKAVGDFARSQDSFANQSRILDAAIEDLSSSLGAVLLPAATKIVRVFIKLITVFNNLVQAPKKAKEQLEAFQTSLDGAARKAKGLNKELKDQTLNLDVDAKNAKILADAIAAHNTKQKEAAEATRLTNDQLQAQSDLLEKEIELLEESGQKIIDQKQKEFDEEEAHQFALIDAKNMGFELAEELRAKDKEAEDKALEERLAREMAIRNAAAQTVSALASAFATLASINKKFAGIAKATALADATIQGFLAVQRALASAPPPFNFILAGAVGIQTAANVAKIASTSLQTPFGGDRVVPGPSNQGIPAIVHGGERIGRGGGGMGITVNFNGVTGDPSQTAQQVINLIQEEQRRTGFGV